MTDTIIITRHDALIAYLYQEGICHPDVPVIKHATAEEIRGKRVVGSLPLPLCALAASVVHIPFDIPVELRGQELTLEQVYEYAKEPREFVVQEVELP